MRLLYLLVALIMTAMFAIALLCQGCAPVPAGILQPHNRCIGDVHSYRLTPDGHKWYLDCVNQT